MDSIWSRLKFCRLIKGLQVCFVTFHFTYTFFAAFFNNFFYEEMHPYQQSMKELKGEVVYQPFTK